MDGTGQSEPNTGLLAGLAALAGATLTAVLAFILKWDRQKNQQQRLYGRETYDRHVQLLDRMQRQVDAVNEEMSRRLVAENAAREENAKLRAQVTFFYAIMSQYYAQLKDASITAVDLPERPDWPTPDQERAELEFMSRSRRHNTDLISSQTLEVKRHRPDSDANTQGGAK